MTKDKLMRYTNKYVIITTKDDNVIHGKLELRNEKFFIEDNIIKVSHIKHIEFDYDVKTLIIPDIHLKTDKILDHARLILEKDKEIKQVIFLGDYFDDWGLDNSYSDYMKTIADLFEFSLEYPCHFLIGNHDVPYLTGKLRHYSSKHPEIVEEANIFLQAIKPQVAILCNDYLLSHAGFIHEPKKQDFKPLNIKLFEKYEQDEYSPLWIRPNNLFLSSNLRKQIVGHTPVTSIKRHTFILGSFESQNRKPDIDLLFTDVYSTTMAGEQIGESTLITLDVDGEIIYHKNEV